MNNRILLRWPSCYGSLAVDGQLSHQTSESMNRRLRFYCTIMLVLMGIVLCVSLYELGKAFGTGVSAGYALEKARYEASHNKKYAHSKEFKELQALDEESDLRASSAQIKFNNDIDSRPVKVKNEKTGKYEKVWIMSADIPYSESNFIITLKFVYLFVLLVLSALLLITYFKLIRNFRKSENIFSIVNLRLIKRITLLTIINYITMWGVDFLDTYSCAQSFELAGRTVDYLGSMNLTDNLFEIPVMLIICEVFAIGVKMREENELTV